MRTRSQLFLCFSLLSFGFLQNSIAQEEESISQQSIRGDAFQESSQEVSTLSGFASNFSLRNAKKVGVGVSFGGPTGFFGTLFDLNINKSDSALTGLGFGPGYNNFYMAWKHSFEGFYLTPYTNLGYSHWFGAGKNGNPRESTMLRQTLNEEELQSGRFDHDFFAGSLGFQYNQLSGATLGLSFFAQFDVLQSWQTQRTLLSAAIGSLFYF